VRFEDRAEEQIVAAPIGRGSHGLADAVNGTSNEKFVGHHRTNPGARYGRSWQVGPVRCRSQRDIDAIVDQQPRARSGDGVTNVNYERQQRQVVEPALPDLHEIHARTRRRASRGHQRRAGSLDGLRASPTRRRSGV
jgi:hypothetical protein